MKKYERLDGIEPTKPERWMTRGRIRASKPKDGIFAYVWRWAPLLGLQAGGAL